MVQEVFLIDKNIEMLLLLNFSRQSSRQFPTMHEITHGNGKSVCNLFTSNNLAALRLFSEDVDHSSFRPAIVYHLDRDDFYHLSILHIDNLKLALLDLAIKKVLVGVSKDSIELLWACFYLVIGYIIDT